MKNIYIDCDCHSEIIRVEKHEKEFWFSFWQEGFSCKEKYSIFERIKLAFRVFKYGHGYSDMIILSSDKVRNLIEFLKEDE